MRSCPAQPTFSPIIQHSLRASHPNGCLSSGMTDPSKHPPHSATASRVIPSQQPQPWSRTPEEPGVVSLWAAHWTRCNGWYLQGSWIWCLLWPCFHLPKWVSLKHQGKSGVISIVQILGLDSQLPAPAERSCCNPKHQAPDFQHWNQSLKLKKKWPKAQSVSPVYEFKDGGMIRIWTHTTNVT